MSRRSPALFALLALAGCQEPEETDPTWRVTELAPGSALAPGSHIEVRIGEAGAPLSRTVRARLDTDVERVTQPLVVPAAVAEAKLSPGIQQPLAAAADDTLLDVVVAAVPRTKFGRLPSLDHREPRDSAANRQRLQRRRAEFARMAAERIASQAPLAAKIRAGGGRVDAQQAVGNAIAARMPARLVKQLAEDPDVGYIRSRAEVAPPPADTNPNNDLVDGRAKIGSDGFFNEGYIGWLNPPWLGLIDTGVRRTHTLLSNPAAVDFFADCVKGGPSCFDSSVPGFNPSDAADHGTGAASILTANANLGADFRGVTGAVTDSWKVGLDAFGGGTDVNAVPLAFDAAVNAGDLVIAAVIQVSAGVLSDTTTSANDAYDMGVAVFAANGNFSGQSRAPANGHKVLGIAGYDVETGALGTFSKNTTGLYKPDLMMPNCTEVASSASDTAQKRFCGTSGATPYAAATGQILRDFYWSRFTIDPSPGDVYASMIAFGNQAPNRNEGAGRMKLDRPHCSRWMLGADFVSSGANVNIPFTVGSGESNLKVGLWWPNPDSSTRNNIDLRVFRGTSQMASSVVTDASFERAQVNGTLGTGNWSIQLTGATVFGGSQLVYYLVYSRTPC